MRSSKIHKLNMRNYVNSMNRLNKETHAPLVKCMEGITGVSHSGIREAHKPVDNTIGAILEIGDEVNAIN